VNIRSLWNLLAIVATLALTVAVAVVAVTKAGPEILEAVPTATASPSPSASESPKGLEGDGPFVVYAAAGAVYAYDVDSGSTKRLGDLRGKPSNERSRQPGSGRLVAFLTDDGTVWTVTRAGMQRAGVIPSADGEQFDGSVLSPDDRKVAVAALAPDPATLIMDLETGRTAVIRRTRGRSAYPPEPLLPVAWSLGGTLLYQIPLCRCDAGSPGLYTLDTVKGTSAVVSGTEKTRFYQFAVSNSAQALYYGTGTARRCRSNELAPCQGAPFTLRKLAAGQRGSDVLVRANDASFLASAISPSGDLLLVARVFSGSELGRVELYSAAGDREPSVRGLVRGARPVALLPRDVVVAELPGVPGQEVSLVLVRAGRAQTLASNVAGNEQRAAYLGWLS
jgi:hypothetical protein